MLSGSCFGDDPFFTGVALLLWCIPVQAIVEILLPIPQLFILIDIIEIVVALACSYLMLTARTLNLEENTVVTDLTFATDGGASSSFTGSENGIGADPTLTGIDQPRRNLPPELAADYPFAIGSPQ